jgi:hypothetical protein
VYPLVTMSILSSWGASPGLPGVDGASILRSQGLPMQGIPPSASAFSPSGLSQMNGAMGAQASMHELAGRPSYHTQQSIALQYAGVQKFAGDVFRDGTMVFTDNRHRDGTQRSPHSMMSFVEMNRFLRDDDDGRLFQNPRAFAFNHTLIGKFHADQVESNHMERNILGRDLINPKRSLVYSSHISGVTSYDNYWGRLLSMGTQAWLMLREVKTSTEAGRQRRDAVLALLGGPKGSTASLDALQRAQAEMMKSNNAKYLQWTPLVRGYTFRQVCNFESKLRSPDYAFYYVGLCVDNGAYNQTTAAKDDSGIMYVEKQGALWNASWIGDLRVDILVRGPELISCDPAVIADFNLRRAGEYVEPSSSVIGDEIKKTKKADFDDGHDGSRFPASMYDMGTQEVRWDGGHGGHRGKQPCREVMALFKAFSVALIITEGDMAKTECGKLVQKLVAVAGGAEEKNPERKRDNGSGASEPGEGVKVTGTFFGRAFRSLTTVALPLTSSLTTGGEGKPGSFGSYFSGTPAGVAADGGSRPRGDASEMDVDREVEALGNGDAVVETAKCPIDHMAPDTAQYGDEPYSLLSELDGVTGGALFRMTKRAIFDTLRSEDKCKAFVKAQTCFLKMHQQFKAEQESMKEIGITTSQIIEDSYKPCRLALCAMDAISLTFQFLEPRLGSHSYNAILDTIERDARSAIRTSAGNIKPFNLFDRNYTQSDKTFEASLLTKYHLYVANFAVAISNGNGKPVDYMQSVDHVTGRLLYTSWFKFKACPVKLSYEHICRTIDTINGLFREMNRVKNMHALQQYYRMASINFFKINAAIVMPQMVGQVDGGWGVHKKRKNIALEIRRIKRSLVDAGCIEEVESCVHARNAMTDAVNANILRMKDSGDAQRVTDEAVFVAKETETIRGCDETNIERDSTHMAWYKAVSSCIALASIKDMHLPDTLLCDLTYSYTSYVPDGAEAWAGDARGANELANLVLLPPPETYMELQNYYKRAAAGLFYLEAKGDYDKSAELRTDTGQTIKQSDFTASVRTALELVCAIRPKPAVAAAAAAAAGAVAGAK